MRVFLAAVAVVALATFSGAAPAWAGPVLEFTGGTNFHFDVASSLGWSFTINQAITVTALDAFDPTGAGAGAVRLYDGTGTVLTSATVTTGDPQEGSPILFYSHAISPVTLAPSTTYYITEDFAGYSTGGYDVVTSLMTNPAITYGSEVAFLGSLGNNPTTDGFGGGNPGLLAPTSTSPCRNLPVLRCSHPACWACWEWA